VIAVDIDRDGLVHLSGGERVTLQRRDCRLRGRRVNVLRCENDLRGQWPAGKRVLDAVVRFHDRELLRQIGRAGGRCLQVKCGHGEEGEEAGGDGDRR
jgi:hypothetical protein